MASTILGFFFCGTSLLPTQKNRLRKRITLQVLLRSNYDQRDQNLIKNTPIPPSHYAFGPFRLDVKQYRLFKRNKPVRLSKLKFCILQLLLEKRGEVVTYDAFWESCWRGSRKAADAYSNQHKISVHIDKIRDALGEWGTCIESIRSVGYRFSEKTLKEKEEKVHSSPRAMLDAPAAILNAEIVENARHDLAQGSANQSGIPALFEQYRKHLLESLSPIRFFGETKSRQLEQVFVALDLVDHYERPHERLEPATFIDEDIEDGQDMINVDRFVAGAYKVSRVSPDKLLYKIKRGVIIGSVGNGKTTLLKYLALKTLSGDNGFPIFIELKTVQETTDDLTDLLFDAAIANKLKLTASESAAFKSYFLKQLKDKKVSVFLDGLDEVTDAKWSRDLCQSINRLLESAYSPDVFMISTRPHALQIRFRGLREMRMARMSTRAIREFLSWALERDFQAIDEVMQHLRRHRDLLELGRVPLLLGIISSLYRQSIPLGESRLALYRQIVNYLVNVMDREKGVARFHINDPDGSLKKDFLSTLAYDLLLAPGASGRGLVFTGEQLLDCATKFCRQEINPYLLSADVKATPLLSEIGADLYSFSWFSLQEYLAAIKLNGRQDRVAVFCRSYLNPSLVETEILPMTVGLMHEADTFLAAIAQLPESLNFANLRLRARCLAYIRIIDETYLMSLSERLLDFVRGTRLEETPYASLVIESFSPSNDSAVDFFAQRLTPLLFDGDEWDREGAAEALGALMCHQSLKALLAVLKTGHQHLRWRSAHLLGRMDDERAVDGLLEALHDENVYVRDAAATSLGSLGDERAIDDLVQALREKEHDFGFHAAYALSRIGGERVMQALSVAIKDQDEGMRSAAVDALVMLGGETSMPWLLVALEDQNARLRREALRALWPFHNRQVVVKALLQKLGDTDVHVREEAEKQVAHIGGQQVKDGVYNALDAPSSGTRALAARLIGKLKDEEGVDKLAECLGDNDKQVRLAAVDALATIGNAPAIEKLLSALFHEHPDVQTAAARWMGDLHIKQAAHLLLKLLPDPNSAEVSRSAASAIIKINEEDSLRVVLDFSDNADAHFRWVVARSLEPGNGEQALRWSLGHLKDSDVDVRLSSVYALCAFPSHLVLENLAAVLGNDPEPSVRTSAAAALGKLADKQAVPYLIKALGDDDSEVWERAARSLECLQDERAVEGLAAVLKKPGHHPRSDVTRALCVFGNASAMKALLDTSAHGMKIDIVERITNMQSANAIAGLIELLKDADRDTRLKSANIIVKILSEDHDEKMKRQAYFGLRSALIDQDEQLRVIVEKAVSDHEYNESREGLLQRLRNRQADINLGEALKRIGGNHIVKELIYLLRNEHAMVRSSAAKTLGKIESADLHRELLGALEHEDKFVRLKAIQVIGYYGDDLQSIEELVTSDFDDEIKIAASDAMARLNKKRELLRGLMIAQEN